MKKEGRQAGRKEGGGNEKENPIKNEVFPSFVAKLFLAPREKML